MTAALLTAQLSVHLSGRPTRTSRCAARLAGRMRGRRRWRTSSTR
ncbi:hypothetical protein [Paracoccus marcusii]